MMAGKIGLCYLFAILASGGALGAQVRASPLRQSFAAPKTLNSAKLAVSAGKWS
jgi:hypothetical protein